MMYGYGNGGAFGIGAVIGMMFFGLLVLIGIVFLIVWAVRAGEHGQHYGYRQHAPGAGVPATHQQWPPGEGPEGPTQPGMHDPALNVARERYARGDITREQYEEIVRTLGYEPRQ